MIVTVKTNTTLTMDDAVLAQLRAAAAADGATMSAWAERAVRAELMRASAAIAADWERTGDPESRAATELAEQAAMAQDIRVAGQGW